MGCKSGQFCTLYKDRILNAKFLGRSSLVSCLLISLVACDSQDSADTGGEFTAQSVDSTISGYYQLVSVNDEAVPGLVNHRFTQLRIHAGDFTIRSDGSCSTRLEFSPPFGGKELRVSHCEYEQEGSQLTMRWLGAGQTVGELAGSSFSTDNQGMEFVFQRTQPIGSLTRLDLSDECDRHIEQSVAQTKGPRIVDDFSGELISGLNRQGLDIGFLTFQDSPTTRIAMSTTGKHPPRAGETSGNAVLQLDLDVRQWAGVIHAFENEAVTRWTPQNWEGLSELQFWFYGRNRQTTLFIEILDNRRPCPDPVGAEVFTYEFTDDFSGWRQISVPFSAFRRKEIFNDAPSDGLSLDAVHGWTIGSLDTGGLTTYYIDDIEVR